MIEIFKNFAFVLCFHTLRSRGLYNDKQILLVYDFYEHDSGF